ncbi:uncharacterized protein At2g33490-like [Olea europaea subsp. europaea]|uniref:Uncharacterized protein At2g33490-like n=1 Tax=Olea europaea subsp. europaea TaxID=158383 RepID=A0A8S0UT73_OLEEU|nr:uncharacterized protein At2g33490-like [Olea europaea subsp. europaea]
MKTSLKKLRGFAEVRHEKEERRHQTSLVFIEVDRASQDMVDLRDCYERLFSVAAETANNAYEFSESLGKMGDCLLEKTALNDDEESGKVLLMLGKVQLELQKIVDGYRSNVFKTITIPSESILNELRIVEEMKRRCDHKREMYNDLMLYREKGKLKGSRGERFSSHQFQVAQDEYEEEANAFVFRMKSLKQGESHSLLTQAARHHAAQLSFFKKALKSLEGIEPHVKMVAAQQHIDYQFSGLEDDQDNIDDNVNDEDDSTEDDSVSNDDGELSFDYRLNSAVPEVSTTKNSMELDNVDTTSPSTKLGASKENLERTGRNSFGFHRETKLTSQSAPIFREKKLDPAGMPRQMLPSPSRRFTSYVLPTPVEAKSLGSGKADFEDPQHKQVNNNLWYSSPLDQKKYEKVVANEKSSDSVLLDAQQVLTESNNNTKSSRLPPPLLDGFSSKQFDPNVAFDTRKVKRQAFSGPITGKPWPKNPNLSASGHIISSEYPLPFSGSILRAPLPQPTSMPKLSSRVLPTFMSSPIISELHELPLPPAHLASKRLSNRIAHSGPLVSEGCELPTTSIAKSTLPMPSQTISRSYSIPSGSREESVLHLPLEASQNLKMTEGITSPPITPISLPDVQPASPPTS